MAIELTATTKQTFLVCNNEALSTTKLILKMAVYFQRKPRLLNILPTILLPLLTAIGLKQETERLLGFWWLDNHKICQALDWQPLFPMDANLAQTVTAYLRACYYA
jgi:hypothetical protein